MYKFTKAPAKNVSGNPFEALGMFISMIAMTFCYIEMTVKNILAEFDFTKLSITYINLV